MHTYKTLNAPANAVTTNTFTKKAGKPLTIIGRDSVRILKPRSEETIKLRDFRALPPRERPARLQDILVETKKNKTSQPLKLTMSEFDKAKGLSIFSSQGEVEGKSREMNAAKQRTIEEASIRRKRLEDFDHSRIENSKLSEVDQEAKEKANYLLAKAQLQLEEQEDEIKHMKEVILYAKCVAIRDAQVEEKNIIKMERQAEERRLDEMMEVERIAGLQKMEEHELKRKQERRRGAATIREQIQERSEAALLEQEKKDTEVKVALEQIAQVSKLDQQEKEAKLQKSRALLKEVAQANLDSIERRKQKKMEDKLEDLKVMEYIKEKEAKEQEKDKLEALKKIEREQDLARLRAQQEKLSDKQAQQDALRAQRAFESYEREWRRKEKERVAKQVKVEEDIRQERIKQQESRAYALALEAQTMRVEFFERLEAQKVAEAKVKLNEATQKEQNQQYSKEIKAQITEKEDQKRRSREEFFMEGIRQSKERREQATKIAKIKERKLAELRSLGVPEKYCTEVYRKTMQKTIS